MGHPVICDHSQSRLQVRCKLATNQTTERPIHTGIREILMGSASSVKTRNNHHTYRLHTKVWGHNTVEICLHVIVFGENFTGTCDKSSSLINCDTGFGWSLVSHPRP